MGTGKALIHRRQPAGKLKARKPSLQSLFGRSYGGALGKFELELPGSGLLPEPGEEEHSDPHDLRL